MKKKLLRALILLAAAACSAALFSSCAAVDDARAHQAVSEDGGETYTIDGVVYKALISQFTARPTDFESTDRVFVTKPDVPTLLARSYYTTVAEINNDRTILLVDYRIFIREDKYDDYKTLLNETDFDYYGTYMFVKNISDSGVTYHQSFLVMSKKLSDAVNTALAGEPVRDRMPEPVETIGIYPCDKSGTFCAGQNPKLTVVGYSDGSYYVYYSEGMQYPIDSEVADELREYIAQDKSGGYESTDSNDYYDNIEYICYAETTAMYEID